MKNTYHYRGRSHRVCGRMRINRRQYLLLERLSGGDRQKFHAVCPAAGPGAFRLVQVVRRSPQTDQLLKVLCRTDLASFNFPDIQETEREGDSVTLVTSWIRGESLAKRLQRAADRPHLWPHPWIAFRLFRGLAHALHYLNNRLNIVHGDLHPGNLLLVRDPNRLIITDFGSAWTVEESVRRLGGDGRTDGYASPEQHRRLKRVDFRSDMFSASVIGYVMLTGELPYSQFGGKAGLPALRTAISGRCLPPSARCARVDQLRPELWRRIDSVLLRGLRLDANERFSDTNTWVEELNDIDAHYRVRPRLGLVSRLCMQLLRFWNGAGGSSNRGNPQSREA